MTEFVIVLYVIFTFLVIVKPFYSKLSNYDRFHLIPEWSFFAPNPGTNDYNLLFRLRYNSNKISNFQQIKKPEIRKWSHLIYNPNKRTQKVIFDLTMDIIQCANMLDNNQVMLSTPYLYLLNYLQIFKCDECEIQFAIISSEGIDSLNDLNFIFISDFHG